MGRHSAPDDEGDLLVAPVVETAPRPSPRPRHAVPDSDLVDTDVIEPELVDRIKDATPANVVDAEVVGYEFHGTRTEAPGTTTEPVAAIERAAASEPAPAVEPVEATALRPAPRPAPASAAAKSERAGRADLRLLRSSQSLRARCAAAVLLPFILYTIVLVVISRVDVYLFWVWIPAIVAGVLFGAQLDMAARAASTTE